jgi:hypothetical protein
MGELQKSYIKKSYPSDRSSGRASDIAIHVYVMLFFLINRGMDDKRFHLGISCEVAETLDSSRRIKAFFSHAHAIVKRFFLKQICGIKKQ